MLRTASISIIFSFALFQQILNLIIMRFSQTIIAAATASFAAAKYIRCGTPNANATHIAEMNAVVDAADARVMAAAAVSVDVYVHVVTTSTKQGQYSQSMVNEQISVMVGCIFRTIFRTDDVQRTTPTAQWGCRTTSEPPTLR